MPSSNRKTIYYEKGQNEFKNCDLIKENIYRIGGHVRVI